MSRDRACDLSQIEISPQLVQRFESFVYPDPNSGCWIWAGCWGGGYGTFRVGSKKLRTARMVKSHRLAWRIAGKEIPAGLSLCHKCDTRCCVNPDHLFLGDHTANMADMARKWRSKAGRGRLPYGVALAESGYYEVHVARVYRGRFLTVEEAAAAALQARKEVYGKSVLP